LEPAVNPYPTTLQLRVEATSARLLAEQAAATLAFRALVSAARDGINRLNFPLGSPAQGYALDDVAGMLADWLKPVDALILEERADDAMLDLLDREVV
jgi:hypothetical protein